MAKTKKIPGPSKNTKAWKKAAKSFKGTEHVGSVHARSDNRTGAEMGRSSGRTSRNIKRVYHNGGTQGKFVTVDSAGNRAFRSRTGTSVRRSATNRLGELNRIAKESGNAPRDANAEMQYNRVRARLEREAGLNKGQKNKIYIKKNAAGNYVKISH